LQAIEAGAEDIFEEPENGETVIYTAPNELAKVRDALKESGADAADAEQTYVPNNNVEVSDPETARKVVKLMDALEDIDDVTNTHTNFEITEEVKI
jgi:transcriptional/translational regulatory protein YebC/TACO1